MKAVIIITLIVATLITAGLFETAANCGAEINGFGSLFTSLCTR